MDFLEKQDKKIYMEVFAGRELYDTPLFELLVAAARKAEAEYYAHPDEYIYGVYVDYMSEPYFNSGNYRNTFVPIIQGRLDHIEIIESGVDAGVYIFDTGICRGGNLYDGSGVIRPERV